MFIISATLIQFPAFSLNYLTSATNQKFVPHKWQKVSKSDAVWFAWNWKWADASIRYFSETITKQIRKSIEKRTGWIFVSSSSLFWKSRLNFAKYFQTKNFKWNFWGQIYFEHRSIFLHKNEVFLVGYCKTKNFSVKNIYLIICKN